MRGRALRLKTEELRAKARRTTSRATMLAIFETLCDCILVDHRKRVTDSMRAEVLSRAAAGDSPVDIASAVGISTPTVRKIIKEKSSC